VRGIRAALAPGEALEAPADLGKPTPSGPIREAKALEVRGPEAPRSRALTAIGLLSPAAQSASAIGLADCGVLAAASRILAEDDFLRFFPPKERRSVLGAIKAALRGSWSKLRDLAHWITARKDVDRTLEKAEEHHAQLKDHLGEGDEGLSKSDLASIAGLLEGPIASFVRERNLDPPRDLRSLLRLLKDPELTRSLVAVREREVSSDEAKKDVEAALVLTRTIIDQMDKHVELGVADSTLLDASGKLDQAKVSELPPALRIVFQDPAKSALAVAALKRGESISSQLLRGTPAHVLEDLHEVSLALTGGSYLWVEDYLKTGRRPTYSKGDVARAKKALGAVADGIEKILLDQGRTKAKDALDPELHAELDRAFDRDRGERPRALRELAERMPEGEAKQTIEKIAKGLSRAIEIRAEDPEGILKRASERLDGFESFRDQSVRIRVHGGSAQGRGLEARLKRDPTLTRYGSEVLQHTVGHDYANETAKTARSIITSVAGLALLGIPIQQFMGEGAMHAVLSTSEDVLGDVSEMYSLHGQGISWKKLLLGWRNSGTIPVLLGAMWLAGQAHHAIEAGKGAIGGLDLGLGATALTLYTSAASFFMFRSTALELAAEGKLNGTSLSEEARGSLGAVARRATDVTSGVDAEVPSSLTAALERAFDRASKKLQSVPDGRALAQALAEDVRLKPETRAAITTAQDDVLAILRSGADVDKEVDRWVGEMAEQWVEGLRKAGLAIAPAEVKPLAAELAAKVRALDGAAENTPERISAVVRSVLTSVLERASNGPLTDDVRAAIDQAMATVAENASSLDHDLKEGLNPELKKAVNRFAWKQLIANPVRQRLLIGVGACIALNAFIGAVCPWLFHSPLTIALTGSTESILTAVLLKIGDTTHRRALRQIGEQIAGEAEKDAASISVAGAHAPSV
jgi:hypothetical protein